MSCNKCGQAASLLCAHVEIDGSASSTHYCSKACQIADWTSHKDECNKSKHRKQLYAAGRLLQQMFYVFREESFEQSYEKLGKDANDRIHIFDCVPDPEKFLFRFPDYDIEPHDKHAILSHVACDEIVQMSGLLEKMIKGLIPPPGSFLKSLTEESGIHTSLYEQEVRVKASRRRIVAYSSEGSVKHADHIHQVFGVTLKDGHDYIIDLAGAQYGQYQAVMPFEGYLQEWVASVEIPHRPFGILRIERQVIFEEKDVCDLDEDIRSTIVQDKIAIRLGSLVDDWEKAKGITLEKLIRQAASTVEQQVDQLLGFLRSELEAFVKRSQADGSFAFERLSGYENPTFKLR